MRLVLCGSPKFDSDQNLKILNSCSSFNGVLSYNP